MAARALDVRVALPKCDLLNTGTDNVHECVMCVETYLYGSGHPDKDEVERRSVPVHEQTMLDSYHVNICA